VDLASDAAIQAALRAVFPGQRRGHSSREVGSAYGGSSSVSGGGTLLCIAHRLDTVMDFDVVAVVERGRVVQAGRPAALLQDAQGPLAALVRGTGPASAARLMRMAAATTDYRQ